MKIQILRTAQDDLISGSQFYQAVLDSRRKPAWIRKYMGTLF